MRKYFVIECKLTNGLTRYFCLYQILDSMEMRMVKSKNEAIIYTERECERARLYLSMIEESYNISSIKIIKA